MRGMGERWGENKELEGARERDWERRGGKEGKGRRKEKV